MWIREVRRRATPELLERYLKQLPHIREPREFQSVLQRARATAAVLGVDIAKRLDHVDHAAALASSRAGGRISP